MALTLGALYLAGLLLLNALAVLNERRFLRPRTWRRCVRWPGTTNLGRGTARRHRRPQAAGPMRRLSSALAI